MLTCGGKGVVAGSPMKVTEKWEKNRLDVFEGSAIIHLEGLR
jgi:hypothetical protein